MKEWVSSVPLTGEDYTVGGDSVARGKGFVFLSHNSPAPTPALEWTTPYTVVSDSALTAI